MLDRIDLAPSFFQILFKESHLMALKIKNEIEIKNISLNQSCWFWFPFFFIFALFVQFSEFFSSLVFNTDNVNKQIYVDFHCNGNFFLSLKTMTKFMTVSGLDATNGMFTLWIL